MSAIGGGQLGALVRRCRSSDTTPKVRGASDSRAGGPSVRTTDRNAGRAFKSQGDKGRFAAALSSVADVLVALLRVVEQPLTPVAPRDTGQRLAGPQWCAETM